MEINLFTLVIQVINFLVLLYLLRRFLYGPIVRMMEEREQRIAQRFAQAEDLRQKAEQEARRYRQERREIEQQREALAARAEQEVAAKREAEMKEVYAEVEMAKRDWLAAMEREKENFQRQVEVELSKYTQKISSRALQDLANRDLESQMMDVFIQRIVDMDEANKEEIAEAIAEGNHRILVKSAFTLSDPARNRLAKVLQDHLAPAGQVDVRFERSPEIISGVELVTHGQHINWTIRDYLDQLQNQVMQIVKEESELPDMGGSAGGKA